MTIKRCFSLIAIIATGMLTHAQIPIHPGHPQYMLNEPIDISGDFYDFPNTYYQRVWFGHHSQ